jgi:hypothetical protein
MMEAKAGWLTAVHAADAEDRQADEGGHGSEEQIFP